MGLSVRIASWWQKVRRQNLPEPAIDNVAVDSGAVDSGAQPVATSARTAQVTMSLIFGDGSTVTLDETSEPARRARAAVTELRRRSP
jgi:hypothetical protein